MEATLSRIESQLIEQNEAIPGGFRFEDGEGVGAPSRQVRHRQRSLMEIPVELQTDILVRLPVKSILLCKCVSKHFRNIIQNPKFVQMHLNGLSLVSDHTKSLILDFGEGSQPPYYQWDHFIVSIDNTTKDVASSLHIIPPIPFIGEVDKIHFVGSCNGLICLLFWYDRDMTDFIFLLWNPVIKQCRYLPKSLHRGFPSALEFGYVVETDDYLIVKVNHVCGDYVEVYKTSIDSWIVIDCSILASADFTEIYQEQTSVFLNGSFHWTCRRGGCIYILYYKVKDDMLGVMKAMDENRALTLNELDEDNDNQWKLAVLDESLALIFSNENLSHKHEVWVMNEYGVEDSWAMRYQIVKNISPYLYPSYLYPVNYWTNGNLLIATKRLGLYLYDLSTKRRKKIPAMETNGRIVAFHSFVDPWFQYNPQVDGGIIFAEFL